jgi:nucleoside-diphosphate-sugar epimerase
MTELDVVTGAFSFTGRHIAEMLLAQGRRVRTLTRRPDPGHPLAGEVERAPLVFDDSLRESLGGAATLYNTYWMRFERGESTFERAVANSAALFEAAKAAGVRRVVHISVAHAATDSPIAYYRAKARAEEALRLAGLSYAIVRPTIVYGPGDILVNDIAWALRRVPLFLVPGDGRYEIQPVSVSDVARICVELGASSDSVEVDAAGPDRFPFLDFVRLIKDAVRARAWIRPGPVLLARVGSTLAGLVLRDVVATREEVEAAVSGLLASDEPPRGRDRFEEWLERTGPSLGRTYASELGRNFRGYEST